MQRASSAVRKERRLEISRNRISQIFVLLSRTRICDIKSFAVKEKVAARVFSDQFVQKPPSSCTENTSPLRGESRSKFHFGLGIVTSLITCLRPCLWVCISCFSAMISIYCNLLIFQSSPGELNGEKYLNFRTVSSLLIDLFHQSRCLISQYARCVPSDLHKRHIISAINNIVRKWERTKGTEKKFDNIQLLLSGMLSKQMQRKIPRSLTAFSWRCTFIELKIVLGAFLIHIRTHVQTKGIPFRRFWISNRNGTDTINEPSSVINRFPLETVIHRRLALSQLISCRYKRSNRLTYIYGSEYVMPIYIHDGN